MSVCHSIGFTVERNFNFSNHIIRLNRIEQCPVYKFAARSVVAEKKMLSAHPSTISMAATVLVLLLTLLIVADNNGNGAKANPVLDHENQLRNKFNQIDREGDHKPCGYTLNRSKSLTDFGKRSNDETGRRQYSGGRAKRQFDFNIDADHEEGVGTDVVASATANLYKSVSGETRLDGTARYSQHFGDYSGHGKAKVGGSLRFSHKY